MGAFMTTEIPYRNRNQTGWWIASVVLRYEWSDENIDDLDRNCKVWENWILVKASDREEAYEKATTIGEEQQGIESWDEETGIRGSFVFEGLGMLTPIYEDLGDGSEILWNEYDGIPVKKAKSFALPKEELECFQDGDS